ncbi:unnamed protein product, partial [Amoebophrya sp. A25]|eukprot:GSA25T00024063001.1
MPTVVVDGGADEKKVFLDGQEQVHDFHSGLGGRQAEKSVEKLRASRKAPDAKTAALLAVAWNKTGCSLEPTRTTTRSAIKSRQSSSI